VCRSACQRFSGSPARLHSRSHGRQVGDLPTVAAAAVAFPEPPFLHAAFRKAGLDAATSGKPGTGFAVLSVPTHPFIAQVEKYVGRDFADR
jgi:hypothetical protein